MKKKEGRYNIDILDIRNIKSPKNAVLSPVNSFKYIWPSSIPESWKAIMKKQNIKKLQISRENRDTLKFLLETQKYIGQIRKPILSNDKDLFTCGSADRILKPRSKFASPISRFNLSDSKPEKNGILNGYNSINSIKLKEFSPLSIKSHNQRINSDDYCYNHPDNPLPVQKNSIVQLKKISKNKISTKGKLFRLGNFTSREVMTSKINANHKNEEFFNFQ
jgi:hypothetical protein